MIRAKREIDRGEIETIIKTVINAMNVPLKDIPRNYDQVSRATYIGYQVEKCLMEYGYITEERQQNIEYEDISEYPLGSKWYMEYRGEIVAVRVMRIERVLNGEDMVSICAADVGETPYFAIKKERSFYKGKLFATADDAAEKQNAERGREDAE